MGLLQVDGVDGLDRLIVTGNEGILLSVRNKPYPASLPVFRV